MTILNTTTISAGSPITGLLDVGALKKIKNAVIGNPQSKVQIVKDEGFVVSLINALNPPRLPPTSSGNQTQNAVRIEAAHVVASLAYGSEEALGVLLRQNTLHALLYAISHFSTNSFHTLSSPTPHQPIVTRPADTPALRSAFSRALRALASSVADVVGPSLLGLKPDKSTIREDSGRALDGLFEVEALNTYLPLLVLLFPASPSPPPSPNVVAITTFTAQMLATTVRSPNHRKSVTEWLPPSSDRPAGGTAAKPKSRRGWEKAPQPPGAGVPWVAKILVGLLNGESGHPQPQRGTDKDTKLVEAVLGALAALAKENPPVAGYLGRGAGLEGPPPVVAILELTKSRSVDVQLAACLCITHMIRAGAFIPPSGSTSASPFTTAHPPSAHPSSSPSVPSSSSHPSLHGSSSTHASRASTSAASTSTNGQVLSFVHTPSSQSNTYQSYASLEEACTRTVINVFCRLMTLPLTGSGNTTKGSAGVSVAEGIDSDAALMKTKACFTLHYLVSDDAALCHLAFERGCLDHLSTLIHSISPLEPLQPEWEEGEPESLMALREAALTLLATLAFPSDDIRTQIASPASSSTSSTSTSSSQNSNAAQRSLLPMISIALRSKRHVGTRYAACQCVRAMGRAVSVLRTSIIDSGLGMEVLKVVMGRSNLPASGVGVRETEMGEIVDSSQDTSTSSVGWGKWGGVEAIDEDKMDSDEGASVSVSCGEKSDEGKDGDGLGEDRRVLSAALAAVCNIVNDFSPLRPIYLEQKLMPRLVYILRSSGDSALRLNALWAVKNLVRRTSLETKRDIMACLGWDEFIGLLGDPDLDIQEQAFTILRNLAENEEGISLVFHHLSTPASNKSPPPTIPGAHPPSPLLSILLSGLTSSSPDVVLQSAYALANLANSPVQAHLEKIAFWPGMLSVLQNLLVDGGAGASAAHAISTHWPPSSSSASANPVRTAEIRRPVVGCIAILATKGSSKVRREVRESGIAGTLKRLCEWSGVPSGGNGGGASGSHHGVGGTSGMSLSPPTSSSGNWAGRTPTSPTSSSASGNPASGAVYGSWSGGGSMHGSLGHPGVGAAPAGRHGGVGSYLGSHGHGAGGGGVLAIEDDRDVIQRARAALEWLEHGEGFAAGS